MRTFFSLLVLALILTVSAVFADTIIKIQVADQNVATITLSTSNQKAMVVLLARHNAILISNDLPPINGTQLVAAIIDERLKALSRGILQEARKRVADDNASAVNAKLDEMAD